jgi:Rps23 Pro-64 3,4-dihydroxylase Tpa1-like proline 4-hydroxylase
MKKIQYKEDVFVYENFLNKETCKKILDFWKWQEENEKLTWNQISFYESYAFGFYPYDMDLIKFGLPADFFTQLKEAFKKITAKAHGKDVVEVSYHAQKWIEGAFASFHSDNSSNDSPEYNSFGKSKMATFLYLNDDFKGGKLVFKDHPIEIEPKVGMLATFQGGYYNQHEVQLIEKGDRYTIGSFWDFADCEYSETDLEKWKIELKEIRDKQEIQYKEWNSLKDNGYRPNPKKDSDPIEIKKDF